MVHYQTMYATMYQGQFKTNEYGYAVTNSQNISTKIWATACDWQSLIIIIIIINLSSKIVKNYNIRAIIQIHIQEKKNTYMHKI